MSYTTLDLITRKWYSRNISDEEALELLQSRGWILPIRAFALLILVPAILPERIICGLGGDDWDAGPTTWRTILFSVFFSAAVVSPFFVLYGLFNFVVGCMDGGCVAASFPLLSAGVLILSLIGLRKVGSNRA